MEPGEYKVMASRPGEAESQFIQRVVLERLAGWDLVDSLTELGVGLIVLRYDPPEETALEQEAAT